MTEFMKSQEVQLVSSLMGCIPKVKVAEHDDCDGLLLPSGGQRLASFVDGFSFSPSTHLSSSHSFNSSNSSSHSLFVSNSPNFFYAI